MADSGILRTRFSNKNARGLSLSVNYTVGNAFREPSEKLISVYYIYVVIFRSNYGQMQSDRQQYVALWNVKTEIT